MTTEIPKRPEMDQYYYEEETDFLDGIIDHEHSVARVAVEALQVTAGASGICEETGKPICAFCGYVEHADWCRVGDALAKIEASGWTP